MNKLGYTLKEMVRAWAIGEYFSPWGLVNLTLSFLLLSGLSFFLGAEGAGVITLCVSVVIVLSLMLMKSRNGSEPLLYQRVEE